MLAEIYPWASAFFFTVLPYTSTKSKDNADVQPTPRCRNADHQLHIKRKTPATEVTSASPQEEKNKTSCVMKGAQCGNHHEPSCAISNIPHPCAFVKRENAHRLTRAMSVPLQNGGRDDMRRRPTNIFISVAAPLVPLVGSAHSRLAIVTTRPAQPSDRPRHASGTHPRRAYSVLVIVGGDAPLLDNPPTRN